MQENILRLNITRDPNDDVDVTLHIGKQFAKGHRIKWFHDAHRIDYYDREKTAELAEVIEDMIDDTDGRVEVYLDRKIKSIDTVGLKKVIKDSSRMYLVSVYGYVRDL